MSVSLSQQLDDLRQGRAALALTGYRIIGVTGGDAIDWLDSLVTTGVARMEPGEARNSFLLQATGRIRASFIVVRTTDGALLLQPPGQPTPIDTLLGIYRLSSDVTLAELEETTTLLASDEDPAPRAAGAWVARFTGESRPLGSAKDEWLIGGPLADHPIVEVTPQLWVAMGRPSFPTDLIPDALPLEASDQLGDSIDHEKGCYLGQEAIAKTRNFGRTPFVVRSFRAASPITPGDPITSEGDDVGAVTSTAAVADGYTVIARIRAKAHEAPDLSVAGVPLQHR